ncbi:MAG TPA: biotin--[acetyl-CoA-carboxylase] ligase [Rhodocyclaceae bacterium]
MSSLDYPALIAALGPAALRFDVDAVAECESTNTLLLDRAETGAPSGLVILADSQSAGRGRRGRSWYGAPGDSLTFSLLWRFPPASTAPAALSLAVGVGLARALRHLGCADLRLKWPNDLLIGTRKLGGVLVELQSGNVRGAVIGIGLNLRRPADMPAEVVALATSLHEAGVNPSREVVLATCLADLAAVFDTYAESGFAALREEWMAAHAHQGQLVNISGSGAELSGRCMGVDADGALLLQTAGGLERVLAGDVSLRPFGGE